MVSEQIKIESLGIVIKRDFDAAMTLRTAQAMEALLGWIKAAYLEKGVLAGSHGEHGGLGALQAEVRKSRKFLESVIGFGKSGAYLANIDQGERGTIGGPSDAPFKRTKAPPIKNIYQWIRYASIPVPDYYDVKAEDNEYKLALPQKFRSEKYDPNLPWYSTDPMILFAHDIAMKRKKYGMVGLKIIEKVAREKSEKIKSYIEGIQ